MTCKKPKQSEEEDWNRLSTLEQEVLDKKYVVLMLFSYLCVDTIPSNNKRLKNLLLNDFTFRRNFNTGDFHT